MSTTGAELLRDLVAEVAALRSALAELGDQVQLARAELDEVLSVVKALAGVLLADGDRQR